MEDQIVENTTPAYSSPSTEIDNCFFMQEALNMAGDMIHEVKRVEIISSAVGRESPRV